MSEKEDSVKDVGEKRLVAIEVKGKQMGLQLIDGGQIDGKQVARPT
jgi:hypothetical protein